ncbi:hypothetical protein E308F_19850 [Moorella sp. E308F]|nr:hypothetical protein E308F_19850 [Moorella sp. E308F]
MEDSRRTHVTDTNIWIDLYAGGIFTNRSNCRSGLSPRIWLLPNYGCPMDRPWYPSDCSRRNLSATESTLSFN